MGLFVHLYMLTNKLPNHDEFELLFYPLQMARSGRWFLQYPAKISSSWSMPWVNGTLSILYLAFASCFLNAALHIQKPLFCILSAAFMVAFPSVAATFTYMSCADPFCMSILLTTAAVFIAGRYRFGFLVAAIPITLSLGIYQAYFSLAAGLFVVILMLDILNGSSDYVKIILKGCKFVASLILGLIAYFVIVKWTTVDEPLKPYQGISDMGRIPLSDLPRLIGRAYDRFFGFFSGRDWTVHSPVMKYICAAVFICLLALIICTAVRKRVTRGNLLLLSALLLVFPLSCSLTYIMAPKAVFTLLMIYPLSMAFIFPLALADSGGYEEGAGLSGEFLRPALRWLITGCCILSLWQYVIFSNKVYFKMDLAYEQAYAFSNRLISRIESLEGFSPAVPVVLIGRPNDRTNPDPTPELSQISEIGIPDANDILGGYSYITVLQRFLGYPYKTSDYNSKASQSMAKLEAVRAMPVYPAEGSVKLIEGKVVVKFQQS